MASEPSGKTFDIELPGVTIHVTHKRVKRINMRIAPDGTAQMSVPLGTPYERVLKVAEENADWFREQCEVSKRNLGTRPPTSYTIDLGGLEVQVTHKRVKRFNMRLSSDGQPELSAPIGVSRAQVEQVAREYEGWYREAYERWKAHQPERPFAWDTGDTFSVWGKKVTIRVVETTGAGHAELEGDELLICVPKDTPETGRELCVERFLERQLKAQVEKLLPDCTKRVGASPKRITLKRMKSRWGSCTKAKGTIRLNVALAEHPVECCECVLCHELCHLKEANHGPRFYALLSAAYPEWPTYQGYLDKTSPGL